jgi:hypothetical protein
VFCREKSQSPSLGAKHFPVQTKLNNIESPNINNGVGLSLFRNVYITQLESNMLFSMGTKAGNALRVWATIRHNKHFAGQINLTENKISLISSSLKMSKKVVKTHIEGLIKVGLLEPVEKGWWAVLSRDEAALVYEGGNARIALPKSIFLNRKTATTFLYAAHLTAIESTYKISRGITPHHYFIPNVYKQGTFENPQTHRTNSVKSIISSGKVVAWRKNGVHRSVGSEKISDYQPLSSEYVESFGLRKAASVRGRKREVNSQGFAKIERAQWLVAFKSAEERDRVKQVLLNTLLESDGFFGSYDQGKMIHTGTCTVVAPLYRKGMQGVIFVESEKFYLAFDIASNFTSLLKVKKRNVSKDTSITINKLYKEEKLSIKEKHCLKFNISKAVFKVKATKLRAEP